MPCKWCYCENQDGYPYCECTCEEWDENEEMGDCDETCPHYCDDGYDPYDEYCREYDARLHSEEANADARRYWDEVGSSD